MFSHVMVGSNDLQASKVFYDAILATLGYGPGFMDDKGRCFYITDSGVFAFGKPINGEPASHGNGGTIGFAAKDSQTIDAWHAAGIANGGETCEEPPGPRGVDSGKLYIAYLRDPSGNKICALHR